MHGKELNVQVSDTTTDAINPIAGNQKHSDKSLC